jgi:hypothetical protein
MKREKNIPVENSSLTFISDYNFDCSSKEVNVYTIYHDRKNTIFID